MASYHASPQYGSAQRERQAGASVGPKILALFLGIAVGVLAIVAVVLVQTADDARDEAKVAAGTTSHAHLGDGAVSLPLESFAGRTAENAAELALAHPATPAALSPVPAGEVVKVHMTLKDMVVEIAPGVKYNTWAFDGHGAPGPIVHVREGQTVEMTLTNGGAIPHSIDFHAARIAPNVAFRDVAPGDSFTFRFRANDPGVYMYHCGTKPVLAHIANGMYGAIVVDPATPLPKADHEFVLVASEWYLSGDGIGEPASLDMTKARAMQPDWTTFNGYANQYVTHPLTADPGDTVRFYVVAAGPTLDTDFHVVGTIFDRAWVNGDMTQFQQGVQTVGVPAGGGAVFDVKIDEPGLYPFVSHAFAHVDLGQVGVLKIGNPRGGSSH
ncbi:MAG TPA: multicopper oxidase domain-containing protein [Gaiellaceae bacterium]|nr:multicopper oxidase domain-containing protein [Gaiellaceae bacterium]